jgi:enterochelin esterase-like enzyme
MGDLGWPTMSAESDEPRVDPHDGSITFTVDAVEGAEPLSVWFHLRDFGADPTFSATADGRWTTTIPAPPVDRLEYLLAVRSDDGTETLVVDPLNPLHAPGVFGDKSVLELPGYRAPTWLSSTSPAWTPQPVLVPTSVAGVEVRGELLTPPGSTTADPLPLLVVHDGPEYSRLARLGDYLAWLAARRPELRCRVLLLQPKNRDLSYAASKEYTDALVRKALPKALALAPGVGLPVGIGASLGALALAHAASTYPGSFAGLFCQSGSFFLPRFDAHERRFPYYDRVVRAVEALYGDPAALRDLEVGLTAGLGEENLENNRALAEHLRVRGVSVSLAEGRDGHNYTAWRDLLDPALDDLLSRAWSLPKTDRRDRP